MPITTADFPDLSANSTVQWANTTLEFPLVRTQLANVVSVSEKNSAHSNMGNVETAHERDEGGSAHIGSMKQGYKVTLAQTEIAEQYNVTKQMRMFDKYDEIMKGIRGLRRSGERRMELDIAAYLYNAWSSSYTNLDGSTVATTTPDGNTLIYTSHACNGSSNVYSNSIAGAHDPMSVDTLEELEDIGNGLLDEADGRVFPVIFDTIITSQDAPTVHMVKRILGSEKLQGTGDNDMNTFSSAYKHLIVPFLNVNPNTQARNSSMSKYCFLAALNNKDVNGLLLEESQALRLEAPEQVFENSNWEFMTTALYDHALLRANWIVGSKGDTTSV